ncbi:response regulator [Zeaxanthinibacter enoshimensis]|uniref:histidine kinase n=1 Tax=Zeaxanthinibacter enoshimensis TaxID=392009 RepID=A0A4R6TLN1_9FLAO|nr:response regulator [Zeaxanthinibacter enoshimensis]TDQ31422.1 Hpt domain-containing protein [Zeaxanthinibacter enoshimensis]
MKSDHLLDQLNQLEAHLNHFSFDELSSEEASELKNSFQSFREQLEKKIWGERSTMIHPGTTEITENTLADDQSLGTDLQLISMLSNEFQRSLNGISAAADLLKDGKLDKSQLQQLRTITDSSEGLMNITNELHEYAKLSSGSENFETVSFNLPGLVNEVVYLGRTLIVDKKISLTLEMDKDVPEFIVGDPSKLSQVLLTLLGNAIKYIRKGEVKLIIEARRKNLTTTEIDFKITDTGPGMGEEELEQLLIALKPGLGNKLPNLNGPGLGLCIVRQIIERQQGIFGIDSIPGKGTTCHFKISFPLGKESGKAVTRESSPDPGLVRGSRILVFEDNLLNQKIIDQRLKTWGCIPYITENVRYGLQLLEEKDIDLVLMDLCMPVMNGYQVTEIIRNHDNKHISQIPVIALTADFTAQDKSDCAKAGMNDFLLKPFSAEELLSKLTRFIKHETRKTKQREENPIKPQPKTEISKELDLEEMLADCMGQMALLEELVLLFKQNALEFIGKVKMHLDNNDYEGIAQAAHKIKCGLKMFHAERLILLTEQIHQNARTDKDPRHLKFLYECFTEEFPVMESRIQKALDALK